jgi:hypothetical protein
MGPKSLFWTGFGRARNLDYGGSALVGLQHSKDEEDRRERRGGGYQQLYVSFNPSMRQERADVRVLTILGTVSTCDLSRSSVVLHREAKKFGRLSSGKVNEL